MFVDERTVSHVMSELSTSSPSQLLWFAAKQPAVLAFLQDRLGDDSDSFVVAFVATWRIFRTFEEQRVQSCPRLIHTALDHAEETVARESRGELSLAVGCAHRQPALCSWLSGYLADPPLLLTRAEVCEVGMAVAAIILAIDETLAPLNELLPAAAKV